MTTIRILVQITNVAHPHREVHKDFEIQRDLATDPILSGEVLTLDTGILSAPSFLVQGSYETTPPTYVTIDARYGIDLDAAVAAAVAQGWTEGR